MKVSNSVATAVLLAGHTVELGNAHAENISLFEDTLSPTLDEIIKSGCEHRHALAQVVKAEIDREKAVGHGEVIRRVLRLAMARRITEATRGHGYYHHYDCAYSSS